MVPAWWSHIASMSLFNYTGHYAALIWLLWNFSWMGSLKSRGYSGLSGFFITAWKRNFSLGHPVLLRLVYFTFLGKRVAGELNRITYSVRRRPPLSLLRIKIRFAAPNGRAKRIPPPRARTTGVANIFSFSPV